MRIADCELRIEGGSPLDAGLAISHSALRIPNCEFRIPHFAFRFPNTLLTRQRRRAYSRLSAMIGPWTRDSGDVRPDLTATLDRSTFGVLGAGDRDAVQEILRDVRRGRHQRTGELVQLC